MTKKRCELITLEARQETRHVVTFLSGVQTEAKQKCFLVNNFVSYCKTRDKVVYSSAQISERKVPKIPDLFGFDVILTEQL